MSLVLASIHSAPTPPISLSPREYSTEISSSPKMAPSAQTSASQTVPTSRGRECTSGESVYTTKPNSISENEHMPKYPVITLSTDRISDIMASRLATCLLGHVLFLKSQVPFPISQLYRMNPLLFDDARVSKKKELLLDSFDLLQSHLATTFTSLGSALSNVMNYNSNGKVHVAYVLGPSATSVSSARTRVVLELDGLYLPPIPHMDAFSQIPRTCNGDLKENASLKDKLLKGSNEIRDHPEPLRTLGYKPYIPEAYHSNLGDDADNEYDDVPNSEYEGSDTEDGYTDDDSLEEISEDDLISSRESEAELQAAEKLLSRALAIANADPESGLAEELRPMQVSIYLRAPRRFTHPAWLPRQNLTRDLDTVLRVFNDSPSLNANQQSYAKQRTSLKTECVRVRCHSSGGDYSPGPGHDSTNVPEPQDEDNELIWWCWDGKLEGFSDC